MFISTIRYIRAKFLMRQIDGGVGRKRIDIGHYRQSVRIKKGRGALLTLNGCLRFEAWHGNSEPILIKLAAESSLEIAGDFTLGGGTRIILAPRAKLRIGGRKLESGSGITERGLIMVRDELSIGSDFICSWGAFITDSDWHRTSSGMNSNRTEVGDHVWVGPNCSILKGSKIGSGSIVATGAVVAGKSFPPNTLIGGVPARVVSVNQCWSRDLEE